MSSIVLYNTPEINHQYPEFPSTSQPRQLCTVVGDDSDNDGTNDSDDAMSDNNTFEHGLYHPECQSHLFSFNPHDLLRQWDN